MDFTTEELVRVLVTWLGASGPALLLALWGLWDAVWDLRAAYKDRDLGSLRPRLIGQGWTNIVLALTFVAEAAVYVLLGIAVVTKAAHITLTGPGGYVVLVPPVMLIIRVAALRVNRWLRRRALRDLARKAT